MFTDTKDFENKLNVMLNSVHNNPEDASAWVQDLTDVQAHDLIQYALKNNLIDGIKTKLGSDATVSISVSEPRLTYEGLKFIESSNGNAEFSL